MQMGYKMDNNFFDLTFVQEAINEQAIRYAEGLDYFESRADEYALLADLKLVTLPRADLPLESGNWRIEQFKVTDDYAYATFMQAVFDKHHRGFVPSGWYTKLTYCGQVIMSDTPDEIRDHLDFIKGAHGEVFIAGLGIGVVLEAMLRNRYVTGITVVEKSQDVINMVATVYQDLACAIGKPLDIIKADIFDYDPTDNEWDCAWFDIWPTLDTDNLAEMQALENKFGNNVNHMIGHWGQEVLQAQKAIEDSYDQR